MAQKRKGNRKRPQHPQQQRQTAARTTEKPTVEEDVVERDIGGSELDAVETVEIAGSERGNVAEEEPAEVPQEEVTEHASAENSADNEQHIVADDEISVHDDVDTAMQQEAKDDTLSVEDPREEESAVRDMQPDNLPDRVIEVDVPVEPNTDQLPDELPPEHAEPAPELAGSPVEVESEVEPVPEKSESSPEKQSEEISAPSQQEDVQGSPSAVPVGITVPETVEEPSPAADAGEWKPIEVAQTVSIPPPPALVVPQYVPRVEPVAVPVVAPVPESAGESQTAIAVESAEPSGGLVLEPPRFVSADTTASTGEMSQFAEMAAAVSQSDLSVVQETGCMYIAPFCISGFPVLVVDGAVLDIPRPAEEKLDYPWVQMCQMYLTNLLVDLFTQRGATEYYVIFVHPPRLLSSHLELLRTAHAQLPHQVRKGVKGLCIVCTSRLSRLLVRLRLPFVQRKFYNKIHIERIDPPARSTRPVVRELAVSIG